MKNLLNKAAPTEPHEPFLRRLLGSPGDPPPPAGGDLIGGHLKFPYRPNAELLLHAHGATNLHQIYQHRRNHESSSNPSYHESNCTPLNAKMIAKKRCTFSGKQFLVVAKFSLLAFLFTSVALALDGTV